MTVSAEVTRSDRARVAAARAMELVPERVRYLLWRSGLRRTSIAPPIRKQQIVREHGRRYGLSTLVETGTYRGRSVAALRNDFSRIVTIEIDSNLARRARHRFRRQEHIDVLCGDSGVHLPEVVRGLAGQPALYWLDAHYSGGITGGRDGTTPLVHELTVLMEEGSEDDVILVDDARALGTPGYPTLDEIHALLSSRGAWVTSIDEDVLRMHRAAS